MVCREKKDIHKQKERFITNLKNLETDMSINPNNRDLIIKFIRDCRLGKTVKNKQKKIIGEGRCLAYILHLKRISSWLNKNFEDVSQKDMELFIENLESDKYVIKKLSHTTKVGYKKTLKKFYKWLLGNNAYYPELVDWIETYDIPPEVSTITRDEVEKLADISDIKYKTILMFLFDSGARVEEFLNIKIRDLSCEGDIYKVRIVFSKTRPRTIHLPICSRYLSVWLEQKKFNDNDYLFPIGYETLRKKLRILGKKILNKRITPHILRHSSVTYYANLIRNPYKLCYRYGWSMASKMVDRYIDREGIFEEEIPEIVKTNNVSELEKQNKVLTEKLSILKESYSELKTDQEKMKKEIDRIYEGKNFLKLLLAVKEYEQRISKVPEHVTNEKVDVMQHRIHLQDN
jgi:integrase